MLMTKIERTPVRRTLSHLVVSLFATLAALALLVPPVLRAGDTLEVVGPMTEAEIDEVVDGIFARQRRLKQVVTTLYTYREGSGIFRDKTVSAARLEAEMPNKLVFVDMGDPKRQLPPEEHMTILLDGDYFWEIAPVEDGKRRVERNVLNRDSAQGRQLDLATILVGQEIATAKELREHYTVTAQTLRRGTKGITHQLHLVERSPADSAKPADVIDIFFMPREVLPWRVDFVRHKAVVSPDEDIFGTVDGGGDGPTTYQAEKETLLLVDTRTNLDNPPLAPLPPQTFWFGRWYRGETEQTYHVVDGRGTEIPPADVRAILQEQQRAWGTVAAPTRNAAE